MHNFDSIPPVPLSIRGRGAAANPPNRFETMDVEPDPESFDPDSPAPKTIYLKDTTRSIIARNDSPDIGFSASINPYRGCEHGCAYCYARPYHEYLGLSAGLDFETKILVKESAPALLRHELSSRKWQPQTLAISGVTDCYQPVERKLQITRKCLEVLAEFRNPVVVITKNALVRRDIDILRSLAEHQAVAVLLSITTLDAGLTRLMEPRTSVPRDRLEAIAQLAAAKIPAGVMAAPMIPGLNDHEMPAILNAAAQAGAICAGFTILRLPHAVSQIFSDWLQRHFPDRKEKILNRIRDLRGGKLNDPNFHSRMRGQGIWADQLKSIFDMSRKKAGIGRFPQLSTASFRLPDQPDLFQLNPS
ncbi:MAG: PA0069 family radical SAM protein [Tepidisphaeraceae bacterium]|jgi:DNA repair photolyase